MPAQQWKAGARRPEALASLAEEIGALAVACNATMREDVDGLFAELRGRWQHLAVVLYNASYRIGGPWSTSIRQRSSDSSPSPRRPPAPDERKCASSDRRRRTLSPRIPGTAAAPAAVSAHDIGDVEISDQPAGFVHDAAKPWAPLTCPSPAPGIVPGMVPANDNHASPTRETIEIALLLWPLWLPGLVVSLLGLISGRAKRLRPSLVSPTIGIAV